MTVNSIQIFGTSVVELKWSGLELTSIDDCEYSKREGDSQLLNVTHVKPSNLTLRLTDLKPQTKYGIFLTCFSLTGATYKSSLVGFNTCEYALLFMPQCV